ncbi:uncharacterized protein IUM83_13026 [Phytophthora cinnamomi]|uniref:uncharacterized protein n=1 Tax=Phytophthora cinnamomi TaxID=4785 RepID=UPI00355AA98B|nr:hypothetical protein IUM83_13026 [Phytophthora cinnamomi]
MATPSGPADGHDPADAKLDARRRRNRESMRRARGRQRAQRGEMQALIRRLEAQLAELVAASSAGHCSSAAFGQLLQRTELLRARRRELETRAQQFESFRGKLAVEAQQELEQWTMRCDYRDAGRRAANRSSTGPDAPGPRVAESVPGPGRPHWMTPGRAQELLRLAADMFLANAERTDAAVTRANSVLGWSDKRAVLAGTWAQFLLVKDFPHQWAEALVERTWKATVNVDKLRGMLAWPAGMTVRHRLGDNAFVVSRELHLPNSADAEHPICYHYQLVIFRAETPTGFIVSTQNVDLSGGADATASQMLDQQLLRTSGIPLVTMYGFQFERQYCESTGEEVGCRVKLAGRTSNGSLSYAHKVLTEALPSILRWENTYVGPILCITSRA